MDRVRRGGDAVFILSAGGKPYCGVEYLEALSALGDNEAHSGGGVYINAVKGHVCRIADSENRIAVDIVTQHIDLAVGQEIQRAVVRYTQRISLDFFNILYALGVLINIAFL